MLVTRVSVIALAVLGWFAASISAAPLTWKSETGEYTVEAEFVRLEAEKVILRKLDGKEITVPLARLDSKSRSNARKLDRARLVSGTNPADGGTTADATAKLPEDLKDDSEKAFTDGKSYFIWLISKEPIDGFETFEIGYIASPQAAPVKFNHSMSLRTVGGMGLVNGSSKAHDEKPLGRLPLGFRSQSPLSGMGEISVGLESDAPLGQRKAISNVLKVRAEFE